MKQNLNQIIRALRPVVAGSVSMITGAMGIGKTILAEMVIEKDDREGHTVCVFSGMDFEVANKRYRRRNPYAFTPLDNVFYFSGRVDTVFDVIDITERYAIHTTELYGIQVVVIDPLEILAQTLEQKSRIPEFGSGQILPECVDALDALKAWAKKRGKCVLLVSTSWPSVPPQLDERLNNLANKADVLVHLVDEGDDVVEFNLLKNWYGAPLKAKAIRDGEGFVFREMPQ